MTKDQFNLRFVGELLGSSCQELPLADFAIDSRAINQQNTLFFALRGERSDGHDFLQEAKKRGAVAAVVDRSYFGKTAGLVLIRVDDVVVALQHLAKEVQKKRSQKIIAITGSVGKTTTKEFIATFLSEKYTVAKTPGNANSQVGLPLAILRVSGEEEVFVVEMGMSYLHEIEKLVQIAPPEIAVITKVGYSHVDTVPNGLEGIARAKAEILSHPAMQCAIMEYESSQYTAIQQAASCKKITYGSPKADIFLTSENTINDRGEESPLFRLPFSETHFRENFTAAVAVCRVMDLSWEEILKGATKLKTISNRFEKINCDGITFLNDCYNACPESVESALRNLPNPSFGGKTIAVLAEMATLGTYSEEGHKKIGAIALEKVDHLLCFGKKCLPMVELFEKAGRPAGLYHHLSELREALSELSKPGDVILIKGSNVHQLWRLLES
jgi:UDP-N-acetylmuramoyl-tripeptide--D-alanyl-D-alanine ligase